MIRNKLITNIILLLSICLLVSFFITSNIYAQPIEEEEDFGFGYKDFTGISILGQSGYSAASQGDWMGAISGGSKAMMGIPVITGLQGNYNSLVISKVSYKC